MQQVLQRPVDRAEAVEGRIGAEDEEEDEDEERESEDEAKDVEVEVATRRIRSVCPNETPS